MLLVGSLVPYLLLPVAMGRIIDVLASDESNTKKRSGVGAVVVFLVISLVLGSIFALLRSFIFNTAGERVVARLRIILFKSIINQEIGSVTCSCLGQGLARALWRLWIPNLTSYAPCVPPCCSTFEQALR